MTWPVGLGDRFRGVYDRQEKEILTYDRAEGANATSLLKGTAIKDFEDPKYWEILRGPRNHIADGEYIHDQLMSELELLEAAGDPFDAQKVLDGELTPVFFGSALNNFGVEHFLKYFIDIAPPPVARKSSSNELRPEDPLFSAVIFKIQANMDPQHRDRVAFARVCSGRFERNHQPFHSRTQKKIKIAMPLRFFGQERVVIDEAWPGDIIGILDTNGSLRIGDTLCDKKGDVLPSRSFVLVQNISLQSY